VRSRLPSAEDGDPQLIAAAREDVAQSRALVYTYEILPRLAELGGGWRLRLLERGQEVGGGVFPPETERVNDFETDCGLSSGAAPTAAESRRDHGNRLRVSHSPLENPAGFPHLTAAGVNHHAIFPFSKDSGRLIQAGPGSAGGFGRPFGKRSGWSW